MINNDPDKIINVAPLDEEIMLGNSMSLGSSAKSREFLSSQIKKIQNLKLKQKT